MQASSLQFYVTVLGGQSAEAGGAVVGIILLNGGDMQSGIQCVVSIGEHAVGLIDSRRAGYLANYDG